MATKNRSKFDEVCICRVPLVPLQWDGVSKGFSYYIDDVVPFMECLVYLHEADEDWGVYMWIPVDEDEVDVWDRIDAENYPSVKPTIYPITQPTFVPVTKEQPRRVVSANPRIIGVEFEEAIADARERTDFVDIPLWDMAEEIAYTPKRGDGSRTRSHEVDTPVECDPFYTDTHVANRMGFEYHPSTRHGLSQIQIMTVGDTPAGYVKHTSFTPDGEETRFIVPERRIKVLTPERIDPRVPELIAHDGVETAAAAYGFCLLINKEGITGKPEEMAVTQAKYDKCGLVWRQFVEDIASSNEDMTPEMATELLQSYVLATATNERLLARVNKASFSLGLGNVEKSDEPQPPPFFGLDKGLYALLGDEKRRLSLEAFEDGLFAHYKANFNAFKAYIEAMANEELVYLAELEARGAYSKKIDQDTNVFRRLLMKVVPGLNYVPRAYLAWIVKEVGVSDASELVKYTPTGRLLRTDLEKIVAQSTGEYFDRLELWRGTADAAGHRHVANLLSTIEEIADEGVLPSDGIFDIRPKAGMGGLDEGSLLPEEITGEERRERVIKDLERKTTPPDDQRWAFEMRLFGDIMPLREYADKAGNRYLGGHPLAKHILDFIEAIGAPRPSQLMETERATTMRGAHRYIYVVDRPLQLDKDSPSGKEEKKGLRQVFTSPLENELVEPSSGDVEKRPLIEKMVKLVDSPTAKWKFPFFRADELPIDLFFVNEKIEGGRKVLVMAKNVSGTRLAYREKSGRLTVVPAEMKLPRFARYHSVDGTEPDADFSGWPHPLNDSQYVVIADGELRPLPGDEIILKLNPNFDWKKFKETDGRYSAFKGTFGAFFRKKFEMALAQFLDGTEAGIFSFGHLDGENRLSYVGTPSRDAADTLRDLTEKIKIDGESPAWVETYRTNPDGRGSSFVPMATKVWEVSDVLGWKHISYMRSRKAYMYAAEAEALAPLSLSEDDDDALTSLYRREELPVHLIGVDIIANRRMTNAMKNAIEGVYPFINEDGRIGFESADELFPSVLDFMVKTVISWQAGEVFMGDEIWHMLEDINQELHQFQRKMMGRLVKAALNTVAAEFISFAEQMFRAASEGNPGVLYQRIWGPENEGGYRKNAHEALRDLLYGGRNGILYREFDGSGNIILRILNLSWDGETDGAGLVLDALGYSVPNNPRVPISARHSLAHVEKMLKEQLIHRDFSSHGSWMSDNDSDGLGSRYHHARLEVFEQIQGDMEMEPLCRPTDLGVLGNILARIWSATYMNDAVPFRKNLFVPSTTHLAIAHETYHQMVESGRIPAETPYLSKVLELATYISFHTPAYLEAWGKEGCDSITKAVQTFGRFDRPQQFINQGFFPNLRIDPVVMGMFLDSVFKMNAKYHRSLVNCVGIRRKKEEESPAISYYIEMDVANFTRSESDIMLQTASLHFARPDMAVTAMRGILFGEATPQELIHLSHKNGAHKALVSLANALARMAQGETTTTAYFVGRKLDLASPLIGYIKRGAVIDYFTGDMKASNIFTQALIAHVLKM